MVETKEKDVIGDWKTFSNKPSLDEFIVALEELKLQLNKYAIENDVDLDRYETEVIYGLDPSGYSIIAVKAKRVIK
jgi:hypothetical protein